MKELDDAFIYTNMLISYVTEGNRITGYDWKMNISCTLPRELDVNENFEVEIDGLDADFFVDVRGNYSLVVAFYEDPNFTEPFKSVPPRVALEQPVYVEMKIATTDDEVFLNLETAEVCSEVDPGLGDTHALVEYG